MKKLTQVQRSLMKNVIQEPKDPNDVSFLDVIKAFVLYGSFLYTIIDLGTKYIHN